MLRSWLRFVVDSCYVHDWLDPWVALGLLIGYVVISAGLLRWVWPWLLR